MAARLSGRPAPRRKGPGMPEDEPAAPSVQKNKPSRQTLLLISALTAAILLAGLSTAGLLFITLNPSAGLLRGSEASSGAEFKAGPMFNLGQFTVNLGDVDQRRFLRTSLTLLFTTSDRAYLSGNTSKKEAWLENLKASMKEKQPVFQDIVVSTLSAKTAQALGTPQGKAELKAELTTRLNQYLDKQTFIQDVFLTEFIIQ
ncbi:hypothetical protein COW36_12330 [bacterium (Candidatus Blackallbacteria) CG17_big_fil_post_rev_8_21_14_2_50_48_46]|uniref:Flagellar protein FliL n=1 Tax=bacterium (Candidatus Blackallbacteria) CG17_big_fil_post_rev_8_21_14_2_50_48_46 TaxID=2014261 RepID=A0A2M7G3Z2_9BACT|nr:MAG: hypothetical protein COW64_02930 [bacterium (Candidatus Blackallbacteria) CG18_big_fil_WC_8_21_14_2_50_49_26]PIW16547.1 MAG: hypothetical protein COW36_12330 [bacterium (Candidatus Blackallbacteria) CG17_big_fil_post_rev_8_21_14_2_50_48_46]PIW46055.1 MAG: hypothetical protein COW20_17595 [bacterium (Candidatus Blackallbacteria) CG13_big_fil_rev_8_21_14_2_50_49_14]